MRIKHAIFAGTMAALASSTAPALAKHSVAKTVSEPAAPSTCSAEQKTADGTWARLPCEEVGSPQQKPGRSAARSSDQETR